MIYRIADPSGFVRDQAGLAWSLGFIGLMILPRIFYLFSMQKALSAVPGEHRPISPGLVWLSLIPIFYYLWDIVLVAVTGKALADELGRRGLSAGEASPGIGFGVAYCLLGFFNWIPFIGFFTGLATLVCWIVYWSRISATTRRVLEER